MDRYDNNTTRFIKAMDRYILEHAKKLITDFCLKEYNCEGDFSDLATSVLLTPTLLTKKSLLRLSLTSCITK